MAAQGMVLFMGYWLRVFAVFLIAGPLSAMIAEPFFDAILNHFDINTEEWAVPVVTALFDAAATNWFGNFALAAICFGAGVWIHWVALRLDRSRSLVLTSSIVPAAAMSSDQAQTIPSRTPQPKKVALIDDLYPLIYDFSEIYVDQYGDRTANWREQLLAGDAVGYFQNARDEFKKVLEQFDEFRPLLSRYKLYDDIYEMDEGISSRVNAISQALNNARTTSENMSHKFDNKSITLIEEKMEAFRLAIGTLRSYLSQGCLASLTQLRKVAAC